MLGFLSPLEMWRIHLRLFWGGGSRSQAPLAGGSGQSWKPASPTLRVKSPVFVVKAWWKPALTLYTRWPLPAIPRLPALVATLLLHGPGPSLLMFVVLCSFLVNEFAQVLLVSFVTPVYLNPNVSFDCCRSLLLWFVLSLDYLDLFCLLLFH